MKPRLLAAAGVLAAMWLLMGRGWVASTVGVIGAIWWLRHVENRRRPKRRRVNLARLAGPAWVRTCVYCYRPADGWDHIVPFSRGGRDEAGNLAAACRTCNSSKGDDTPEEWWERIGRGAPYPAYWPRSVRSGS